MTKVNLKSIVGRGYGTIWRNRQRYCVVKGGRASKKSKTTALWFIYNIMKTKDANALVVRANFNTMRDSCYADLIWAINQLKVRHLWKTTTSPMELVFTPTGQKILFRGMDNPESLTSITVATGVLCWCWIEEAYQIKSEDAFNKLDLSLRGAMPEGCYIQLRITFNPWSDKHWLKKRFFDNPDENTFSTTTNFECNEFLSEADNELFNNLKTRNPRRYRVEGLGEWGVSEGLVFDNWEELDFSIADIAKRPSVISAFGLDFGYSVDPCGFIATAIDKEAKEIYIFDEIYQKGLTNSDLYDVISRKGYAKEKIVADSAEPKSIEELRRLGIRRIQPAVKGKDSILFGIQLLQDYKIFIHPSCVNTIVEFSNYAWSMKDGLMIDKPVDDYNHIIDALRYCATDALNKRPSRGFKAIL